MSWLAAPLGLDFLGVTGFFGVEIFFFISGFCLFYGPAQGLSRFAYKRAIKIVPSYLLCLGVSLLLVRAGPRDIFTHLLFIHNWFPETYGSINGVLWSLAVEVQFYCLFPLICFAFRRRPWLTYFAVSAAALAYRLLALKFAPERLEFFINQLPGVLDLFLSGMLAAHLWVSIGRAPQRISERWSKTVSTLAAMLFAVAILFLFHDCYRIRYETDGIQRWQSQFRSLLGPALLGLTVFSGLAFSAWKRLLANPVLVFLSTISYNLYLWHALLAREVLKKIPWFATELPQSDLAWQLSLVASAWTLSLLVATAVTYGIERPLLKAGLGHFLRTFGKLYSR